MRVATAAAMVAISMSGGHVGAQSALSGVALDSPAMTEAELTRDDVIARLSAATTGGADLARLKLNGLDLTGI